MVLGANSGFKGARMAKLWQFLGKSPKTRIFWKKSKGETKRNFLKIAQKVTLASKGEEHSGANGIIL